MAAAGLAADDAEEKRGWGGHYYFGLIRHCEERSDEAIQLALGEAGLLRYARNDGLGIWWLVVKHPQTVARACRYSHAPPQADWVRPSVSSARRIRLLAPGRDPRKDCSAAAWRRGWLPGFCRRSRERVRTPQRAGRRRSGWRGRISGLPARKRLARYRSAREGCRPGPGWPGSAFPPCPAPAPI